VFELPAGANLYVDGQLVKGSAARRQFYTPKLDRGQSYFYDVRVEVVREGKVVSDEKRVVLRAGDVVTAKFSEGVDRIDAPALAVASSRR
jgi:uncharacterized protein (TIGR03000 family)